MTTRHTRVGVATLLTLAGALTLLGQAGLRAVLRPEAPVVVRTVPLPLGMSPGAMAVDVPAGRAFITGNRAAVSVLATRSGRILTTTLLDTIPSAPVVDERDGRVYVAGFDATNMPDAGTIDMLDARTGALLSAIPVGGQPETLAVDARTGRVFVLSFNDVRIGANSVTVLDGRSGRVLRTIPLALAPVAVGIDARTNRAFVVSDGDAGTGATGSISVLDATSGRLVHTLTMGPLYGTLAVDATSGHVFVVESVQHRRQVRMLDARSGRVLRTTPVSVGTDDVALTVDEQTARVFVSGAAGPMSMLSATGGRLLSTLPVRRSGVAPAVAVQSARVFVATAAGVSMLDARTGAVLRTITVGQPPPLIAGIAVDGRTRRVFVVTQSLFSEAGGGDLSRGRVSVLDAATGAVLHTAPVGVVPTGLGVDERAGRAFVLTSGGTMRPSDPWG